MTTSAVRTIRDATFDVLRTHGLTRIFANPGSTEIQLLANFPADFDFTLALHEGSVVGMATGYALARREPAMVIVHTTAGLGNAIGAIATARVNRAPLVVLIGQQDRRHIASDPFLAGRIRGLAGEYPVWYNEPVTAQDVPAALSRAYLEAVTKRGPALVVVPMDDWNTPVDESHVFTAATRIERAARPNESAVADIALALNEAKNPVIISGAGNDSAEGWAAAVTLAEKINAPVLHESFAGGAGFPQNHPLFAGFLSASRSTVRGQLAEFDLILSVGAPVFRQYNYEPGDMFTAGTRVFVITPDSDEAHRSPAELAVIADIAPTVRALAEMVNPVAALRSGIEFKRRTVNPPAAGEPLRASQVMAALSELMSDDVILVEETPSSRPDLHDLLPAKQPLGFVSAAMGGLGFGLPAAIGLRMGSPRPVVAILGDGSSMYGIQGLWSAEKYGVGALFIILNNGRYAVMDRLDEKFGTGSPAWPAFDEIDFVALSESLGCPAKRLSTYDDVRTVLAEVIPGLASRTEPLVLVVDVEPELTFAP
jgi:benzoylformate decarboxylase